jgi:hypothetical protein
MKCEHGITPWWDCDPCRGSATFGDDPIQPYFDEHICQGGAMITTRGERRAIMARNHLDYVDVSKKKRGKVYVDMRR